MNQKKKEKKTKIKARLIKKGQSMYQLLLKNGDIRVVSVGDFANFLRTFQDENHYQGGEWNYETSIEEFSGTTMAIITEDNKIIIEDTEFLCSVLDYREEIKLLTSAEYGALHNKTSVAVRKQCAAGRIPGAVLKGKEWIIPENVPYPADGRRSRNRDTK